MPFRIGEKRSKSTNFDDKPQTRLPVDRISRQPAAQFSQGRSMSALNKTRNWLSRHFAGSLLSGWLMIAMIGWYNVFR
jgi:hypothetical protein